MEQKDGNNLQLPKHEVLAKGEERARHTYERAPGQLFLAEVLTWAAGATGKGKLELGES